MLTGHLLFKMGGLTEEAVAKDAGNARVARVQATADPALGVVGQVLGVVDPVNPIVQPDVMIGVLADSDG